MSAKSSPEVTMVEVAEKLGVTRQAVWLWANGKGRPGYAQMIGLRDHFGIPIDSWADDVGEDGASLGVVPKGAP